MTERRRWQDRPHHDTPSNVEAEHRAAQIGSSVTNDFQRRDNAHLYRDRQLDEMRRGAKAFLGTQGDLRPAFDVADGASC